MSPKEYAAAHRAAVKPKAGESECEPKPVSKMTPAQYAAAKKKLGIR
jgi:hypothetical protein